MQEKKSANQKYHYMSHRLLQDFQHRCIQRPAPEEWNLAANWHEHDVTNAEFFRTYRSQDFPGRLLVRRLEAEQKQQERTDIREVLPTTEDNERVTDHIYLKCFDDIYGFRGGPTGYSRNVYYLNAWEFMMWWECRRLPKPSERHNGRLISGERADTNSRGVPLSVPLHGEDYGPNPAAEEDDIVFFAANIPGPSNLHKRWYLRRRLRPVVPAPSDTPLPESAKDAESRSKLYLVYMRPWTLLPEWSSAQVPLIQDLDLHPEATIPPPRRRLRQKTSASTPTAPQRSFYASWRWYIRGHVVSEHAQRIIVQFMAANCGRSQSDTGNDDLECQKAEIGALPSNDLSLARIHKIIDQMSQKEDADALNVEESHLEGKLDFPDDLGAPVKSATTGTGVSASMKDALATTGKMWPRTQTPDVTGTELNKTHISCPHECGEARQRQAHRRKTKKTAPKERKQYQAGAYHT